MRKKPPTPSRLSQLGDLHVFDQSNGLAPQPSEGRYREAEHTDQPEQLHGLSQEFR